MGSRNSGSRRYVQILAGQVGLDREDRIALARYMFDNQELESYTDLSNDQISDMIWLLKGHRQIQELRLHNGSLIAEADKVTKYMKTSTPKLMATQDTMGYWDVLDAPSEAFSDESEESSQSEDTKEAPDCDSESA